MPTSTRRISYVVPFPPAPPPWLQLPSSIHPRNGSPSPLLFPSDHPPLSSHASIDPPSVHPQHSLGVPAMALDTSTQLAGEGHGAGPQGILYTGGRDGLLAGWELGMRLRRRPAREGYDGPGKADWVRWNELGVDGEADDDADGEPPVAAPAGAAYTSDRQRSDGETVPYEDRWEVEEYAEGEAAPQPTFRSSCQFHTDWVNDILLTNLNRTLISASSDRTIRAWSPHSESSDASTSSTVIGHHHDFVRCLAHSRHQSWVASGGFDRHIKLWDVSSSSLSSSAGASSSAGGSNGRANPVPLLVLNQSAERTEKSSIYSLATNVQGSMVASGSPEQTVNVWDPRMGGAKRIAKLVGHTDNVRSLLLSEDGRFMLSGSADATVKLWSMSAQRVIHTFTHHEDSIWSLASTHPNLERFYAGDRSGTVSVTDLSRCQSVPEGESYVLCQEGADRTLNREGEASLSPLASRGSVGINKIVTLGDQWVWTSTSSSDVHLWKDVGARTRRVPAFRPTRPGAHADAAGQANGAGGDDDDEEGMVGGAWAHSPPPLPTPILAAPGAADQPPSAILANGGMAKRLSLDRTPSREVAFAPHPPSPTPSGQTQAPSPFANSPLANLHRPAVTHQHSSAQTVISPVCKPALDSIPYESLVSLGPPESPYGSFGGFRGGGGHPSSRFSVGSNSSFARHQSGPCPPFTNGDSANPTPTQQHPDLPDENGPSPYAAAPQAPDQKEREARFEFEEREVVGEAVPLRLDPAGLVKGRSGLVRSLMLNDRQHAITLSTAGVIAVWNIVLGTCLGLIAQEDVLEAHLLDHAAGAAPALTPRGALELVKERIEGEAVVPAWCTVDTKIGALGIHMEQGRCFDAEIHLDELGDQIEGSFKEDQRVSLGKLLLANLFSGFVDAEVARAGSTTPASSTPKNGLSATPTPSAGSISRSSAPTQISFAPPTSYRPPPSSTGTTTPGLLSALATPAMTPALAPEAADFFQFKPVGSAPGSPGPELASSHKAPSSPLPDAAAAVTQSQQQPERGRDYFSIPSLGRTASSSAHKRLSSATSQQASASAEEAPSSPSQPTTDMPLQTPGGSFLGKFKGLGKGKKASAVPVATPAAVVEVAEDEASRVLEDEKYAGLSEADRYQKRVLENLFSQELTPPNPHDVPFIGAFPDATIFIDEESKDAGAWAVTYRGLASSTASDVETLEMALPTWVLEFLLTGRSINREPVKISFVLEPEDPNDMDVLPGGNNRLSANRALRARKISSYVMDRLGIGAPRSRAVSLSGASTAPTPQGSPKSHSARLPSGMSITPLPAHGLPATGLDANADEAARPEDIIELVCGGVVVPPRMTLAAVKHVFRQSGDVHLKYRRKQGVEFTY